MILTKKRYGKTDGYIAWHGYQSFKPEEVTPQLAHEIGVKLAKEMWGDRFEIIVTTHLDKEHIHCHFCFNSVSFRDGGKYNYSKAERKRMMEISDRLCREYGLSVIEKPHKAPSRPVWLDEKNGKPTRYNVYRADVQEAIDFSRTPYYMEDYLRRKGYITDFTGRHWKIRLPQYEHFTRLDTLDERWTPEKIRLGRCASFGNRRAYISYPPQMPQELSDWFRPFHKTSHIYKQYLHYGYLLGYLPKHTDYKPTSPFDRITDHLAAMPKQERIAWFRRSAYVQPLNFIREIDGTVYAVRAFFKEDARENITDKVQRIILKSDDNSKEI